MIIFVVLLGIMYFCFTLLCVSREEKRITFNAYNLLILFLGFIYGIMFPISYILSIKGYTTESFMACFRSLDELDILIYYIVVFCVTISILIALRSYESKLVLINLFEIKEVDSDDNKILVSAIIMLAIGITADFLYLRAYGSYANYMRYAQAIRSGIITTSNSFSFLYPIRECGVFATYLFWSLLINRRNTVISTFLFAGSVFFSIRVMFANGGRLSFIIYFLILIIYFLLKKHKPHYLDIKVFVTAALLLVFFWAMLQYLGNAMSRNMTDDLLILINKEISFNYVGFFTLKEKLSWECYRFFVDLINLPIFLLPSRIRMNVLHTVTASDILTVLSSGSMKGVNGVSGAMPIDFMGLSLLQIGYLGIMILPYVYTKYFLRLCKKVSLLNRGQLNQLLATIVYFQVGLESFYYADPNHIMSRALTLIIFFIIYKLVCKVRVGDA